MNADQVRALMRKKLDGTTQMALAYECGVSPQFFGDVLRGKREPSPKILAMFGLERVVEYRQTKRG